MHYVYEVCFPSGPTVVVRIASEEGRHAMRDSVRLSRLLRPRGVPLPEIVVEQADGPVPFVVLERLPGVDLGPRLATLSREELLRIADRAVSRPQAERSLESLFRRFLADVERG
jgi:aminoglycoside phosphotransferase